MALFIRFYGPETYCSPRWPTRDRVIPFRTFELMYGAMDHIMALEQLHSMQATAHGQGVAMNGSDPKVKSATRNLVRRAHPEAKMKRHGAE